MNSIETSSYRESPKKTLIRKPKSEREFRFKHPRISRGKPIIPVRIAMELADRGLFPRVHRFASDGNRFAIHSREPIEQHSLLSWQGVTFKVAAIDRFEVGSLFGAEYYQEVKCLIWGRLQG